MPRRQIHSSWPIFTTLYQRVSAFKALFREKSSPPTLVISYEADTFKEIVATQTALPSDAIWLASVVNHKSYCTLPSLRFVNSKTSSVLFYSQIKCHHAQVYRSPWQKCLNNPVRANFQLTSGVHFDTYKLVRILASAYDAFKLGLNFFGTDSIFIKV